MAISGCGPVEGAGRSGPEPSVRFARPLEAYRDLGLMTGSADFPAVASIATLAGPSDSTLLLFGLSLPTSALRFQRDGAGFVARYVVSLRAARDSRVVARIDRQETVRVLDFAETARTEESVLFQTMIALAPGEYAVTVRVRDGLSARGFVATDTVAVPEYGPDTGRLADPVVVYRASSRTGREAPPGLVLNPRHSVSHGDEALLVYVESYSGDSIRLEIEDARGDIHWRDAVGTGGHGMSSGVVALAVDSLPMGPVRVRAFAGDAASRPVALLVTLSDGWLVANFSELAEVLRHMAPPDELDAMRAAGPEERRRLWNAFWAARDPVPATPANEYRDRFFERIRVASMQFAEPGLPGWLTDRGRVYIVLGPPSRLTELRYDEAYISDRPPAQEWVYEGDAAGGRLSLVFVDRNGLEVYRLTESSKTAFQAAAERVNNVDHR